MRQILTAVAVALATVGAPAVVHAQISSSLQSISLTASKGESVTLGSPTPSQQTLTIVDGAMNTYAAPFSITLNWDVKNSTTTMVNLVGYFATPAQALANGTDVLAAALIEVSTDGGTTWKPATGNAVNGVGSVGGSVTLFTSLVTTNANARGTKVVSFMVRINLVGAPATAAGTYTGTMNLMAISK
jgi:hypothetical protein